MNMRTQDNRAIPLCPSLFAVITFNATEAELRAFANLLRFLRMKWIDWVRTLTRCTYPTGLKISPPHYISSSIAIERSTMWA